jgi:hypothetical protein
VDNDRFFALYALTLIAGVASVITACVTAGTATLPSLGIFVEHLALSLTFRGAYKSFGGFGWIYTAGRTVGVITAEDATSDTDMVGARA